LLLAGIYYAEWLLGSGYDPGWKAPLRATVLSAPFVISGVAILRGSDRLGFSASLGGSLTLAPSITVLAPLALAVSGFTAGRAKIWGPLAMLALIPTTWTLLVVSVVAIRRSTPHGNRVTLYAISLVIATLYAALVTATIPGLL
jgi:hypothetical protein